MVVVDRRTKEVHHRYLLIGASLIAFLLFMSVYFYAIPSQYTAHNSITGAVSHDDLQCANVPAGMEAWWSADDAANRYIDTSGNGHDGTPEGDTRVVSGFIGNAFSFDGDGDYITVPDDAAFTPGSNPFTIEGWIRTEDPDRPQYIVYHRLGGDGYGIVLSRGVGGCAAGDICIRHSLNSYSGVPSTIEAGVWTHLAVVREGNDAAFYINGESVGSVSDIPDVIVDPPSDFVISIHLANLGFSGLIDELTFYRRALTADEIEEIYDAGSAGKCALELICTDDVDNDRDGDTDCDDEDCTGTSEYILTHERDYEVTLSSEMCTDAMVTLQRDQDPTLDDVDPDDMY